MSVAAIERPAPDWQDIVTPLAERLSAGSTADVRSDDAWSEAGRKVLGYHFGRVLVRVPGVVAGQDPEEVHAMRVAARRMRAAWRVFGDAYDRRTTRAYLDELRTLGGRLGVVRDLDVRLGILVDVRRAPLEARSRRAAAAPGGVGGRSCRSSRRARRDPHHGLVRRGRHRSRRLRRDARLVGATRRGHGPRTSSAIGRRRSSGTTTRRSRPSTGGLDRADVATLHELRIAAKWLRYTLEFVREPMGPSAGELIRRVVVLQDYLGDIHDLHAAAVIR